MAHEKPPRPDQPLRPWLGRVVKNLFRMQLRGDGRRLRREQIDADLLASETAATTEELLHRVEAQRRLVELVQALEEPMRTTLLLHYYEGLSSAEIARRLQIPAGTVRWRLKTGLDRLRSRLDESYGRRALWMAALTPTLRGLPPMNPMTPLLKTGLLVTLGVAATAAVIVATHHATRASSAAPVPAPRAALPRRQRWRQLSGRPRRIRPHPPEADKRTHAAGALAKAKCLAASRAATPAELEVLRRSRQRRVGRVEPAPTSDGPRSRPVLRSAPDMHGPHRLRPHARRQRNPRASFCDACRGRGRSRERRSPASGGRELRRWARCAAQRSRSMPQAGAAARLGADRRQVIQRRGRRCRSLRRTSSTRAACSTVCLRSGLPTRR